MPRSRFCPVVVAAMVAAATLSPPTAGAADSTLTLPPVKVGGFVQLDYRRVLDDYPAGAARHEMAIRRARLSVSGRAHERVGYQIVLAGDRPTTSSPVSLLDAIADVDLTKDWKLRAGQYKYEFDIEAREPDERTIELDRAFATYLVAGSLKNRSTPSNPASSSRDRGLSLLGTIPAGNTTFELAAGVFQGSGRAPDDDSEVAYALRGRVRARTVMLNVGWRACPDTGRTAAERVVDRGWTAGVEVTTGPNRLRAEMHARDQTHLGNRLGGGYVLDVLRVRPALDVFGRAQLVDLPDRRIDPTLGDAPRVTAYDLGARWYFMRRDARTDTWFAVNYMIRDVRGAIEADWFTSLNDGLGAPIAGSGQLGDVLVARFQVAF